MPAFLAPCHSFRSRRRVVSPFRIPAARIAHRILALALGLLGSVSAAQPSLAPDRWRPPTDTADLRNLGLNALPVPEKLVFDIIWGGWSFRWVHAGQATLEMLPTANPKVIQVRSLAWCNKFFNTFYPVQDTVSSFLNFRGLYPLRFDKILHEGSYHARISADYRPALGEVITQDTLLKTQPFPHDILSAFTFIRSQKLAVGNSFELSAVSGKKSYRLKVLVHGEERVTVPAGTWDCLVVEPVLKDDGLFKAKGKLLIYMDKGPGHLPVKMVSKIPVGSIKADLVRFDKPQRLRAD